MAQSSAVTGRKSNQPLGTDIGSGPGRSHYLSDPVNRPPYEVERRRRLVTRAVPLTVIAVAAFIAGASTGSRSPPEKAAAERYVEPWVRQDFAALRAELSPPSR